MSIERVVSDSVARWIQEAKLDQIPKHHLVLMTGPSGAGKTTWTTDLARQLGLDQTASPSYALHLQSRNAIVLLDHWDLDRIQSSDDLESTGFGDWFHDFQAVSANTDRLKLAVIEWPERLIELDWIADFADLKLDHFTIWVFKLSGPPAFGVTWTKLP